jgi:nucleotide-binding universal stress UspA family protein
MYKKIVVGTNGAATADKAVQTAAELARTLGAELHIIVAFRTDKAGLAQVGGMPLIDTGAEHALREAAERQVSQKATESWGTGITVEHHEIVGEAADVLLDTAESLGADLIVVGSKGMRGARRYLGSVPNSVCHGAHCAVLVVKTD